jgi:hypothetical protein
MPGASLRQEMAMIFCKARCKISAFLNSHTCQHEAGKSLLKLNALPSTRAIA